MSKVKTTGSEERKLILKFMKYYVYRLTYDRCNTIIRRRRIETLVEVGGVAVRFARRKIDGSSGRILIPIPQERNGLIN